ERAVGIERHPRGFLRPGGSPLDEAAEREAVPASVDQPALQLRLLAPLDLGEAAVKRRLVVAAVELVLALERRDGRDRVRHLALGHEIAAAELDAVDAKILGDHVEQPLAEEIGLE